MAVSAAVVAGIAAGALGLIGQLGNSAAAIYNNERTINFNREEAQKARDFEKMMSDTAFQRQVADLEKAGLNKYLAYNLGGASSASGSAASVNGLQGTNFDFSNLLSKPQTVQDSSQFDNLNTSYKFMRDKEQAVRKYGDKESLQMLDFARRTYAHSAQQYDKYLENLSK